MKKTKVVIWGSCFSRQALVGIEDFLVTLSAHHVRSDILLDHIQGARKNISKEQLDFVLQQMGADFFEKNKNVFKCQSSVFLDKFFEYIRQAEILIMDNQYEISSSVYSGLLADNPEVKFVLRNRMIRKFTAHALVDINESLSNLHKIVDYVKSINPDIKIFFLPYPHSHMGNLRAERIERSQNFNRKFNIKGLYAFPSLHIPENEVDKVKGELYFTRNLYSHYGRKILELSQASAKTGNFLEQAIIAEKDFYDYFFTNESSCATFTAKPIKKTPYNSLPEKNFWKPSVASVSPYNIQGLYQIKFAIKKNDILATAGSCFAQHISRYLKNYGFNYKDYEPAASGMQINPKQLGYGMYSARYGNIYTIRHLLQLFERAFGEFEPVDKAWENNGRFYDPFRPTIEPNGFESLASLEESVKNHLANVRTMFTELDIFVFTLGLTEAWINSNDGAVYPLCPGAAAGTFDATQHVFHNFNPQEMFDDFNLFITKLHAINKKAKFLLTVSPVPLTATATGNHVLVATSYSKSALRAVAGMLYQKYDCVDYFPSYEIISSYPFRGMFYEPNLREVTEAGVKFAMEHFFREHQVEREYVPENEPLNDAYCDEVLLEIENA